MYICQDDFIIRHNGKVLDVVDIDVESTHFRLLLLENNKLKFKCFCLEELEFERKN